MAQQNCTSTEYSQKSKFETHMFREIHKNTWLKRISPTNSKKKKEKLWVVFCVHDDTDAFLETYTDNKLAVYHKPSWHVSLNNVQHISPTICAHEQEYEFVLTLSTEVIRLAAPTWEQMLDWVEGLGGKLHELRILSPKENVYTKLPDRTLPLLLPTRDPTSPLPPPPEIPPEILPGIEPLTTSDSPSSQRGRIELQGRYLNSSERNSGNTSGDVFNFENISSTLPNTSPLGVITHYELLFEAQQTPGPSSRNLENRQVENVEVHSRLLERSTSCSPQILQQPPYPYKTLREQQVMKLLKEMKHPSGVKIPLRRKDCLSSIGFVDAFNAVWICGWKQKEHPALYNALHIGDKLVSIEGISIKTSSEANKVLQNHCCGLYVNLVVKRLPLGQIFLIQRDAEGQTLGIIQENNTAVIDTVQADSLAARHGLSAKAKTVDGNSYTNWVLTEINGRPLNLFFIKNQVRDRLNAVGRDISILVQPLDLINKLKKQMKNLRNYKEYILQ